MEVVQISAEALVPNPWNVNRMSQKMRAKLRAYIKREGLVEPIVVRPHPDEKGHYQILGGFHRWSICRYELGYEVVPCVVVEGLDEKRAKVLSLNLNSMSGQPVPSLLSSLLSDLHQDLPMADLEATLPWERGEIDDFLGLMQVPQGFAAQMEKEAAEVDASTPTAITIVLDPERLVLWERVLDVVEVQQPAGTQRKARVLEILMLHYLDAIDGKGGK